MQTSADSFIVQQKIFIYIHAIWGTKASAMLLNKPIRKVLFAFMQQQANSNGIQLMAVDGAADHMHCLCKLLPTQSVTTVVKQLKNMSAEWLNESKLLLQNMEWEDTFAAYSVSPTAVEKVMDYINRQEQYHATKTWAQELELLDKLNLTV